MLTKYGHYKQKEDDDDRDGFGLASFDINDEGSDRYLYSRLRFQLGLYVHRLELFDDIDILLDHLTVYAEYII